MKYNKLVRDKIPGIIRRKGKNPITHVADENEYWEKLREKLNEEVVEFLSSESREELADILEVVYSLDEARGVNPVTLEEVRKDKAEKSGGFKKRIVLDETR